jgi:putative membrane protein
MDAAAHPLPEATKLAVDRTRLAHDRTLLAWIRTSTSLISFGFTIYKFFQYLQESKQGSPTERLLGPREFALLMIGTGVILLVLATLDHWRQMTELRRQYRAVPRSLATVLAAFISLLGLVGLVSVALRL